MVAGTQDRGDAFRFAGELLAARNDAMALLTEKGFAWMSHFSSVDPIHDLYGIEVCGIREEADAERIEDLLAERFPDWTNRRRYFKRYGGDTGWKVRIHRDLA